MPLPLRCPIYVYIHGNFLKIEDWSDGFLSVALGLRVWHIVGQQKHIYITFLGVSPVGKQLPSGPKALLSQATQFYFMTRYVQEGEDRRRVSR